MSSPGPGWEGTPREGALGRGQRVVGSRWWVGRGRPPAVGQESQLKELPFALRPAPGPSARRGTCQAPTLEAKQPIFLTEWEGLMQVVLNACSSFP